MKRIFIVLSSFVPLYTVGASPPDPRIAIPELTSTPFDADPVQRQEYVAGYNDAFKQIIDLIESGAFFHRSEELRSEGSENRQKGFENGVHDALWQTSSYRMEKVQRVEIPLPSQTSFDAVPANREAYLTSYAISYRLLLAEVNSGCQMLIEGPTFEAQQQGYADGSSVAKKTFPAKAAFRLGVPLEYYLEALKREKAATP